MDIKIYNKNLEFQGLIDKYKSFIWRRRYGTCGDFELHLPIDKDALSFLRKGNLIIKDKEIAFLDYTIKNQDKRGNEILLVKGRMASAYLERRIIWNKKSIDEIEQGIRDLIYENVINPSDLARKIERFILGEKQDFNIAFSKQIDNKNLLEEIESLVSVCDLGFKTLRNKDNNLVFSLYKGMDRTSKQSINPPAIFSQDFDNILSQKYTESKRNFKNTALILGREENASIINGEGLDRYELLVKASGIQKEGLSDIEYQNKLLAEGKSKLAEYKEARSFDCEVDTNSNLIYKRDYDLGDLVTIQSEKWGLKLDSRIIEITEIYEPNNFRIDITFGDNIPTLTQKIKREVDTWQ